MSLAHLFLCYGFVGLFACAGHADVDHSLLPDPGAFAGAIGGRPTRLYVLNNSRGALAAVTPYGARLVRWMVPGRSGHLISVIDGLDSLCQYQRRANYLNGAALCQGHPDLAQVVWEAARLNDSAVVFMHDTFEVTYQLLPDHQLEVRGVEVSHHTDGISYKGSVLIWDVDNCNLGFRRLVTIPMDQHRLLLEIRGQCVAEDTAAKSIEVWGTEKVVYQIFESSWSAKQAGDEP